MRPQRWTEVDRLLEAALERAPGERAAFLAQACGDQQVLSEVETLLKASERAGSFLSEPATAIMARELARERARARTGQRIGHYELTTLIGAGGMGEVYRAHDMTLGREVAIKLLPESFASDPTRLRRLEREARAAGGLTHPNVLTIHDAGAYDGGFYLVSELLEGETVRQQLRGGALPVSKALDVARQAARGLAAAHEHAIVHRDIKPENLFVTTSGVVKILDFGLAKPGLTTSEIVRSEASAVSGLSEAGAVMGTVGYMSPEQVRGEEVDARSDVFGFGAVLYELLTGEPAFVRDTVGETLRATVDEEPAGLAALIRAVPPGVAGVVRRCLEKAPERRYANGAELAAALDEEVESTSSSGAVAAVAPGPWPGRRPWWWLALACAVLISGGGVRLRVAQPLAGTEPRTSSAALLGPMTTTRLTAFQGAASVPKFSPDGKQVAFGASREEMKNWDVYVKDLESGAERRVVASPGQDLSPSWSPDGQSLAFIRQSESERAIYTVPVLGGPERKLVTAKRKEVNWEVIDWSPTGELIAYSDAAEPYLPWSIYLVSVETGETRQLTFPPEDRPIGIGDWSVAFSPDGQTLAFSRAQGMSVGELYVVPVAGGEPRRLTFDNQHIIGVTWTPDGRSIVFGSSRRGATTLWRIAREGGEPEALDAVGPSAFFPAVSRDERRLAYTTSIWASSAWLMDVPERQGKPGRPVMLFNSTGMDLSPQYAPDGTRIAFVSNRSGTLRLWVCDVDGSNPLALTGPEYGMSSPATWSPDGRFLAFLAIHEGNPNIYVVGAEGGPLRRLSDHPADWGTPTWSRDGRWIYFASDRSGDRQLWKLSPEGGEAVQVTRHGGLPARESRDGKYLYYQRRRGVPGLWRMSVDGGEEELVSDRIRANLGVDWTLADDGVYFADTKAAGGHAQTQTDWTIKFYSFATGRTTQVATLREFNGMTLSPDGRRLLYMNSDRGEYNIMLVENFRW